MLDQGPTLDPQPALNTPARSLAAAHLMRVDGAERSERDDVVIVEMPVALLYNGHSHAVMMATPDALEDFAVGFTLSEGIVDTADELALVDVVDHGVGTAVEGPGPAPGEGRPARGIALHCAIPQRCFDRLARRRRNLAGSSGCGLCGVESLRDAMRPISIVASEGRISIQRVRAALDALAAAQPLNARSGGVHAAGFARADGLLVREDVGRHNALDKLIGAIARAPRQSDADHGFLVMTSRASYEIVHKAAAAGIGLVVAISAPTDLAIRLADEAGITLAAFARGETLNIYTHQRRITG